MINTRPILPILVFLLLMFSCNSNHLKSVDKTVGAYTLLSEEVLNVPGKSQISAYALYNDTIYEENLLKGIALEIYNNSKLTKLKGGELAKIFMVYIYANKEDYQTDKSRCITMLYKGINDKQPEIAYTMPEKEKLNYVPDTARTVEPESAEQTHEAIRQSNQQYFSGWNGSNPQFVEAVKNAMSDPDSFEHVETTYYEKGNDLRIKMIYRGKNAYNATITSTSTCIFNKSTETVSDIN